MELAPVGVVEIRSVDGDQIEHDITVSCRVAEMVTVDFIVPAAVGGVYADLIAEFVTWVPLPMDRREDGSFSTRIRLDVGRCWRYRFLIDGERWINDWNAIDYTVDDDGRAMSVIRT